MVEGMSMTQAEIDARLGFSMETGPDWDTLARIAGKSADGSLGGIMTGEGAPRGGGAPEAVPPVDTAPVDGETPGSSPEETGVPSAGDAAPDASPVPTESGSPVPTEGGDVDGAPEEGASDSEVPAESEGTGGDATPGEEDPDYYRRMGDEELVASVEELAGDVGRFEERMGLVAINANLTEDRNALARDLAEQTLNAELANAKGLKRFFVGTIFKKAFERKMAADLRTGKKKAQYGEERITIDEIIRRRSQAAIERFMRSAEEGEEGYIHKQVGEKMDRMDNAVANVIRGEIETFAKETAELDEEEYEAKKRELDENIQRKIAELRDNKAEKGYFQNNYLEAAERAREFYQNAVAVSDAVQGERELAQLMARFQVYNAEIRDDIRTRAQRGTVDKILDWYETTGASGIVPPSVIAGVVGAVSAIAQVSFRSVAGAVTGGGIVASGIMSGATEHRRITDDRVRMIRDRANGYVYEGTDEKDKNKRLRQEAKIGGTVYEMQSAKVMTECLESAMEGDDRDALMRAIAAARVRIDFSDDEDKDLISYSSADDRGDERLQLDIALIRAEKSLTNEEKTTLDAIKTGIRTQIEKETKQMDRKFGRMRAGAVLKKSATTMGIGALFFFGTQEVMALASPDRVGLAEKMGWVNNQNNEGATETVLAKFAGARGFNHEVIVVNDAAFETRTAQVSSPEEAEKLIKEEGYRIDSTEGGETIQSTTFHTENIDPRNSASAVKVKYDGWADNGTKAATGNELGIKFRNGQFVADMHGTSTYDGKVLDYDKLLGNGQIKGYLTIGGAKLEVSPTMVNGQLTWGENGVFTLTDGSTIRAIGENGEELFKYFEVAAYNGVDANGMTHIIPFATEVGRNTFSGSIQQLVQDAEQVSPTIYNLVKEVPIAVPEAVAGTGMTNILNSLANAFANGSIVYAPRLSHQGIGGPIYVGEAAAEAPTASEGGAGGGETGEAPSETGETLPEEGLAEGGPTTPEEGGSEEEGGSDTGEPEGEAGGEADSGAGDGETGGETGSPEAGADGSESGGAPEGGDGAETLEERMARLARERLDATRARIETQKELIGGDESVNILLDDTVYSSEAAARWESWWSGLNDEQKQNIYRIIDELNSSSFPHGVGPRSFIEIQRITESPGTIVPESS